MNSKVSIIVPVYNVEKYVEECIKSIINQSYKNIEIIIVDDGSTDKSGEICEKYKKIDSRIKLIQQKNSGVSIARNIALEEATGEYICFVDGDDYIDKNAIATMVNSLKDYEMVICGYKELFIDKEIEHIQQEKNINSINLSYELFTNKNIGGYLWNKIFIADIIKKNRITFKSEIKMLEDMIFVINYLKYINKIRIIDKSLYYYRMRKSSAVWESSKSKTENIFLAYKHLYEMLKNNHTENIDKLYYVIYIDYLKCKKVIGEKNINEIMGENIRNFYNRIIFSSQINLNKKIKLFIRKYIPIIYSIYMKKKICNLNFFE